MYPTTDWAALEETILQDMAILLTYFRKWKLKPSTDKTVFGFLHFHSREANCCLNVTTKGRTISQCTESTYLPAKLHRNNSVLKAHEVTVP